MVHSSQAFSLPPDSFVPGRRARSCWRTAHGYRQPTAAGRGPTSRRAAGQLGDARASAGPATIAAAMPLVSMPRTIRAGTRPADADRLRPSPTSPARGMSIVLPSGAHPLPTTVMPRIRVMPVAGSACHGPGPPARVRRASCPPSGPLRPQSFIGGARGPEEKLRVASLPAPCLSPPPPLGVRGELRRKASPRPASARPARWARAAPRPPHRPSWRDAAGIVPAVLITHVKSFMCIFSLREVAKTRGFSGILVASPAQLWYLYV